MKKMTLKPSCGILSLYAAFYERMNGMYSLYYYDGLDRYWQDIKYLALLILVFGFISFIYTKGKQYDSI